ncbi:MAG: GxxExxY protein [Proteobacteria bacterium]|nr:GxxExxY protein [Pseudomonadota bacterium]MDA1022978.1 GxxExxY protein [Pseudomonadota bacterium]
MPPIPEQTEKIAKEIVDATFKVHSTLGPGLLEKVYETCLAHEFEKRGITFQRQCNLPIVYDGITIDAGLRFDLMVEESVIIELKAVEKVIPLYKAQILTYLKLSGLRLGFLINFNVPLIKNGIERIIL